MCGTAIYSVFVISTVPSIASFTLCVIPFFSVSSCELSFQGNNILETHTFILIDCYDIFVVL